MTNSKTLSHRVKREEEKLLVLELKKEGLPIRSIAALIGRSKSQVHRDIQAALKEFQGLHGQSTELMVRLELARLDDLHRAVWPLAIGADPNDLLAAPTNPPDLRAMDRCIRIMERRAKLLGLDAPAKVAPTDPTGSKPYTGGGLAALLAISEGGV